MLSTPAAVRRPRPALAGATSAWISTSSGRAPSADATTTEPGAPTGRSASRCADGFATSAMPAPRISNTPISCVEPNRFLCARRMRYGPPSPSSWSTTSTRCSSVLGPASAAVLGDVADDDRRRARGLGELREATRRTRGPGRASRGSSRASACRRSGSSRPRGSRRWPRARARGSCSTSVSATIEIALSRGADAPRAHRGLRDRLLARRVERTRGPTGARGRRAPGSAASTCRRPDRRRAAPCCRRPGRRRARDRARRCRVAARAAERARRTSAIETGAPPSATPAARRPRRRACAASSSTSVFHSWQAGQRPSHLASVWPHAWHAYSCAA